VPRAVVGELRRVAVHLADHEPEADDRRDPLRADLGEARVLLDLEPPPLVVGQVPVEGVQLVEREQVDVALDHFRSEKMTGYVEVQSPPAEAGLVFDRHAGHRQRRIRADAGQRLQDGLQGIEHSGRSGCFDRNLCRRDFQAISFRPEPVVEFQFQVDGFAARLLLGEAKSGEMMNGIRKPARQAAKFRLCRIKAECRLPVDDELSGPHLQSGRSGNDGNRLLCLHHQGQQEHDRKDVVAHEVVIYRVDQKRWV